MEQVEGLVAPVALSPLGAREHTDRWGSWYGADIGMINLETV